MNDMHHESLALHSGEKLADLHLPARGKVWKRARLAGLVLLALLGLGAARTVASRSANDEKLATQSLESQKIFVKLVTPSPTKNSGVLLLPATLRGDSETTIYARVTGYVRSWGADIGVRVEKGDLLAELDTPELDQQLAQNIAQRDQARANVVLAKVALERWKKLYEQDSVAHQALDEHQNALDTSLALLAAADANVQQLQQMTGFKKVVAPFSGVITSRNVDIGNLINAGGSGVALFTLAKTDPLRVAIDLPQAYLQSAALGAKVAITQTELQGQVFSGIISHIAGAIDVTTRSRRVELTLANPEGRLLPGAYVQVALPLAARAPLALPSNTLLFRAEGPHVAVVDAQGRAHLRPVIIANDLGATLEISGGVAADDKVIVNPSDSLAEDDQVIPSPLHRPHGIHKTARE
jgi:RND family efflux transporter MFP subunit